MDLTKLKPSTGTAFLHLKSPVDGELLYEGSDPVGIDMYSLDSEQYKKNERATIDEGIEAAYRAKGSVRPNAEKIEKRAIQTLLDCTAKVHNMEIDGEPISIIRLYTEMSWVREQAEEFIHNRSAFMKASLKP
jgi:hypothetical protein